MPIVEMVHVDDYDIVHAVKAQIKEHLHYHRERPLIVLIGYTEWRAITGCAVPHYTFMHVSTPFYNDLNNECYLLGLEVYVVPWFDGILVLPKGIPVDKRKL